MRLLYVACWHETDQPGRSDDVRCSGEIGNGRKRGKLSRLTHLRHLPLETPARNRVSLPRGQAFCLGRELPKKRRPIEVSAPIYWQPKAVGRPIFIDNIGDGGSRWRPFAVSVFNGGQHEAARFSRC